jgi:hypothetical protein
VRVDRKARGGQPFERLPVRRERLALAAQHVVGEEVEPAPRDNLRIKLADGAGSGVARVGELRLLGLLPLGVDALESLARQVSLAANFRLRLRAGRALQAQGHAANGAHVRRHVLAHATVAARHAAHEHALLVVD